MAWLALTPLINKEASPVKTLEWLTRDHRATGAWDSPRNPAICIAAGGITWVFRSLFNSPDVSALIRGMGEPGLAYWRQTICYCRSAATSTTASYEKIRDAATAGQGDKPARSTTIPYRDVLERLWILEPLAGWVPSQNKIAQLATPAKHHLVDAALAARLLELGVDDLLQRRRSGGPVPRDGDRWAHCSSRSPCRRCESWPRLRMPRSGICALRVEGVRST